MLKTFLTCSLLFALLANVGCAAFSGNANQGLDENIRVFYSGDIVFRMESEEAFVKMASLERLQRQKVGEDGPLSDDRASRLYRDADINRDFIVTDTEANRLYDVYARNMLDGQGALE